MPYAHAYIALLMPFFLCDAIFNYERFWFKHICRGTNEQYNCVVYTHILSLFGVHTIIYWFMRVAFAFFVSQIILYCMRNDFIEFQFDIVPFIILYRIKSDYHFIHGWIPHIFHMLSFRDIARVYLN